jgi:hypothetical protein
LHPSIAEDSNGTGLAVQVLCSAMIQQLKTRAQKRPKRQHEGSMWRRQIPNAPQPKSPILRGDMAKNKRTRSRRRRSSGFLHFPEAKGKIVELVEIDPDAQAITIIFRDKTLLSFDVASRHYIFPELSDHKTGNWKGIKRWQPVRSSLSLPKWP